MAKINRHVVRKQIAKGFNSHSIRRLSLEAAEKRITRIKNESLLEFKNHPVTRELKGGSGSPNLSNTLGGSGNLFSFIGFNEGEDPTAIVEMAINNVRINKTPRIREIGKSGKYEIEFTATMPSVKELEALTPMPFEKGRSWLTGIERGISGLSYYIYSKMKDIKASRSGKGIQSDKPYISGLRYKPVGYISMVLKNLRSKLLR